MMRIGEPISPTLCELRRAGVESSSSYALPASADTWLPQLRAPSGDVLDAVRKLDLEGVVSKRIDSTYEPGERSGAWVKLRANREQEFVIGGYIPGARGFDALLAGVYENKEPKFVAKVKSGFVPRIRDELLRPLRRCKLPPTTSAAQQMFLIDTK